MAEAYRTSETRWFFQGTVPEKVTDWFLNSLPGDSMNCPVVEREDIYLLAAGRDDVGLKYRQDSLQLKLRDANHRFSLAGDRIGGVIGDWQRYTWVYDKESFDLAQTVYAQLNVGRRVAVNKKRRQKAYELVGDREPRALRPGEYPPLPLLIEVTEVSFEETQGWTLGLDAVGDPSQVHDRLLQATDVVLRDFPALPLKAEDSLSYPEFLGRQCFTARRT